MKNGFIKTACATILTKDCDIRHNKELIAQMIEKADAEKVMIKMSSLLGFDPVSRRKNPIEVDEVDVLDEILTM